MTVAGASTIDIVRCPSLHICPVASACVPGIRIPCIDLARTHRDKLKHCDALEELADALPSHIDRRKCLVLAATLVPLLQESHAYEETYVFPAFERGAHSIDAGRGTTKRLKTEHVQDECAAQDLSDILFAIGHGAPVNNPEALGFMLRAFFESVRRHIAFEREHFFPFIATDDDNLDWHEGNKGLLS
jgi:hypothetical protein